MLNMYHKNQFFDCKFTKIKTFDEFYCKSIDTSVFKIGSETKIID